MHSKQRVILLILIVLAILSGLAALGLGAYYISLSDVCGLLLQKLGFYANIVVDPVQSDVLFVIRLPRVLLGLLVGAALGISGATVQGIFRNPLAEPGLIGISSGASLFAVLVIAFESLLFTGL